MRYFTIFIISILIAGCELTRSDEGPRVVNGYEVSTIEEVDTTQWEAGPYFHATEGSGLQVSSTVEVVDLLKSLESDGVSIKSAWYIEDKSSCETPGGKAYSVVVPASVIVEVDEENPSDPGAIFQPVDKSPEIVCPYYVELLEPID